MATAGVKGGGGAWQWQDTGADSASGPPGAERGSRALADHDAHLHQQGAPATQI